MLTSHLLMPHSTQFYSIMFELNHFWKNESKLTRRSHYDKLKIEITQYRALENAPSQTWPKLSKTKISYHENPPMLIFSLIPKILQAKIRNAFSSGC